MGKDNNLVERQTFSSEFHLPKRSSIYGFWNPRSVDLSLSLSLSLSLEVGERLLRPPLDPPLDMNQKTPELTHMLEICFSSSTI